MGPKWIEYALWGLGTASEVIPSIAAFVEILTKAQQEDRDLTDAEMATLREKREETMQALRDKVQARVGSASKSTTSSKSSSKK